MGSNKLVTRDHSVPGSRRVGMRTIRKAQEGGEKDRRLEEIELGGGMGGKIAHIYWKGDIGYVQSPLVWHRTGI